MKLTLYKTLFGILIFVLTLLSCENNNSKDRNKGIVSNPIEQDPILVDSLEENNESLVELNKLKSQLDSFAISIKKSKLPFELKTDTITKHSSDKDLWDFKRGIFELINIDSTEQIIRNHFWLPKTDRILRLYLLELKYPTIVESDSFFKKLISRKDYKADLTEGYYLDYGLTGTTDYVIQLEETIIWLNVSCQYTKREFTQLMEIINNNIRLIGTEESIKCYCQNACE